jgi:hypothetical protein
LRHVQVSPAAQPPVADVQGTPLQQSELTMHSCPYRAQCPASGGGGPASFGGVPESFGVPPSVVPQGPHVPDADPSARSQLSPGQQSALVVQGLHALSHFAIPQT